MKYRSKILTPILGGILCMGIHAYAGNQDRAGQAGASELLINPWARTSGWANVNIAGVHGVEGQFLNVAGTAFTKKTELVFSHTNYLQSSGIGINAFGFSQKVGASGVLALGFMSMNFGDIDVTTTEMPEGGLGTYPINFMNIGLSYAKGFTDHIFGGLCTRVINQSIPNARAGGIALDAGIQYVTGKENNVKFGITLKNVGPKMQFRGDGLAINLPNSNNNSTQTVEQRSEFFELPSLVSIGGAYDIYLGGDSASRMHRITIAASFVSNSFTKDEFKAGLEYGFKKYFMIRAGYGYEPGITTDNDSKKNYRTTVQTGISAGFTVELPFNKKGSTFGLDYSYRDTKPFDGTHSLGIRINL